VSEREPMVAGWGNLPVPGREVVSEDLPAITRDAVLSRGLGRSYGDSSLPPPGRREVVGTRLADRILAWDPASGVLRAEAGLSLWEFNRLFMRRGHFISATPGTQFVTLGGMVAADVHGKGHHRFGAFGAHVRSLRMRVADGTILECGPGREPELFWATVGGMGLTGHILEVECQTQKIPTPWILAESRRIDDIDEFVASLKRVERRLAVLRRVDRLPVARQADGPRDPRLRALGRAAREARAKPLPFTPQVDAAVRISEPHDQPADDQGV
jgi:decaprenylphospho-beta-D-ribofuranose 2-oxidase